MRRSIIFLLTAGTMAAGSSSYAGDVLERESLDQPAGIFEESGFGDVGVVDSTQMGELRGREGRLSVTVATDQELTASVVGGAITADNFTTGGVTFGENAFDNFGGVGLVNVVTGNNNAIEAAIGVTFNLLD